MSGLKPLVCEEVFDDRSQPSEEEVREFAVKIGIDPDAEPHLIPLAREGLLKPLPKNWKPVYDPKTKQYYYFNFKTKKASWEHPLDNKFRDLVKKSRSESLSSAGEEDSKTSIKEELKSYEEAGASLGLESEVSAGGCGKESLMAFPPQDGRSALTHTFVASTPKVPVLKSALSPLRSGKNGNQEKFSVSRKTQKDLSRKNNLQSIFNPQPLFSSGFKNQPKHSESFSSKSSKLDWDEFSSYLDDDSEKLLDLQTVGDAKHSAFADHSLLAQDMESSNSSTVGRFTINRVRKIDIDLQSKRLDAEGVDSVYLTSDRFSKAGHGKAEFTLSGGGSMFLKSNKKKADVDGADELHNTKNMNDLKSFDVGDLNESEFNSKSGTFFSSDIGSRTVSNIDSASKAVTTSTRSILRTPQVEKLLWEVEPQHLSVSEKVLWKQQELEEEKKSVRFNLDKELKISFKLSDTSESEDGSLMEEDYAPKDIGLDFDNKRSNERTHEFDSSPRGSLPRDMQDKKLSSNSEVFPRSSDEFSKETSLNNKKSKVVQSHVNSSDSPLSSPTSSLSKVALKSACLKEEVVKNSKDSSPVTTRLKDLRIEDSSLFYTETELTPSIPKINKGNLTGNASSVKDFQLSIEGALSQATNPNKSSYASESVANLVGSLTEKVEDIISQGISSQEDSISKEMQARDQAFRDWNVKQTNEETHRSVFSRQQSQLQLQHVKQQIEKQTGAINRDQALRDWSVIGGQNDSEIPKQVSAIALVKEENVLATSSTELPSDSFKTPAKNDQNVRPTDINNISGSEKSDEFSRAKNIESFSSMRDDELQQKHARIIREKEEEYKLKLEQDEQEIIKRYEANFELRLAEEQKKFNQKLKDTISQFEQDAEIRLKQMREHLEHKQICSTQVLQEQHQLALAAQEVENQAAMLRIREQHTAAMKILREQLQKEEELIRKEHQERILSPREDRDGKRSREITDYIRAIEKLRCEKRLVEDKYRTLKEKYVKLKGEIKANVEKKEQKVKESQHCDGKGKPKQAMQIPSTEQETSLTQRQSERSSEATESRTKATSSSSAFLNSALGFQELQNQSEHEEQSNPVLDPPSPAPDSGPASFSKNNNNVVCGPDISFLGMSHPKGPFPAHFNSNTCGGAISSWCNSTNPQTAEKNGNFPHTIEHENSKNSQQSRDQAVKFSPLEALRHQLRALDEIEEQLPASSVTDAYLRYPFSDSGNKQIEGSELEFIRHRIHLERNLIRQAKNSLQTQQNEYQSRLHNFQRCQSAHTNASPSITLIQMEKEEQELSDMEAKLQRTQSVLGEKTIQLQRLEKSLYHLTNSPVYGRSHVADHKIASGKACGTSESRWADKVFIRPQRRWDWKVLGMEDMGDDQSSDSGGSSGFSSTEYTSDGTLASLLSNSGSVRRQPTKNSSDINVSLQNLNSEISEIWNVLCKQRTAAGLGPPPLLKTECSSWLESTVVHCANHTPSANASSPVKTARISKVVPEKRSSLIERTNNLRLWLQKAKMSASQTE